MDTASFIISLDYELMWGVRDKRSIENYGDAIIGVSDAIQQMLSCFKTHNVKATFAIVGFLFHKDKISLMENLPDIKPSYIDKRLSPYPNIANYLGVNEYEDPYYFGYSLTQKVKNNGQHQLATHTYSHFYCLEPGQTIEQFESDLKIAIKVALENKVTLKSIVFPRNQYNDDYLKVCEQHGISSFRGNAKSWIYESSNGQAQTSAMRALRLIDAYVNLTGHNCYTYDEIKKSKPYNIPSSRFLRPFSPKLVFLEKLKLMRIKNEMSYAAKNNLVYHMWWHPHNFGRYCKENMAFLEKVLIHYDFLHERYGIKSITMEELTNKLINI